jgi:hypothetical protein
MLRQKVLTAPARKAVPLDVVGNVVRWLRKQPGLEIVDGDDGGALRAVLGEVCLCCRSFCAPEIHALV